jgi:outer membrane receptor protein involved in Fe transport
LEADLRNFVYPHRNTGLVAFASAFERNRFKVLASMLGTFVAGNSEDRKQWTPAMFLSYQPFPKHNWVIRTFYKRIFRMPTFNDLYYTDIGNIDLKPEYAVQYNAGLQFTAGEKTQGHASLQLNADAYYNKVTNKIVAIPKGSGQYRWMIMNLGKVKIRGIDLSSRAAFHLSEDADLNVNLNYTFQKAQDFTDPNDKGDGGTWGGQIAYIPQHSGSTIWGANYKSWDANYSFIYVGDRYHNSANIRENYEQPWYTSDLSIGKSFYFKPVKFSKLNGFKAKISLEVNNLLNQYYDVILNYPMPGRNYKLILRMEI